MSSEIGAVRITNQVDRLYHGMNRAIITRLAAAGHAAIRLPHAAVFETIGDGSRISTMAERVGVTKQSMGELVAYLERHGYVERHRDPDDARAFIIRVTPRGRDAVKVAQGVIDEMCERWTSVAAAKRIDAAAATLELITDDVETFARDEVEQRRGR